MTTKIIGIIIGFMIFGAGMYYLIKEKGNAESRKIYGIISLIGVVIITGCTMWMML